MMKKLNLIVIILLSSLVILSAFMIFREILIQQKEKNNFNEIKKIAECIESTNDEITPKQTVNIRNLKSLIDLNSDCVGWIYIEGTNIDYPVMHTPNDSQKYLHKDFYGKYSQSGVPFIDSRCSIDSGNVILYGHNMKNGTMFADLKKYLDSDFLSAHRTVEFETADGVRYFTVTDIVKTNISDKRYAEICSSDGRYLILSTCYGSDKNGRLLVVAEEL